MIEEIKINGVLYKLVEAKRRFECTCCDLLAFCYAHSRFLDVCVEVNKPSRNNVNYKKQ